MVIVHGYVSLPKGITIELLQIFRKNISPIHMTTTHEAW